MKLSICFCDFNDNVHEQTRSVPLRIFLPGTKNFYLNSENPLSPCLGSLRCGSFDHNEIGKVERVASSQYLIQDDDN